MKIKKKKEEKKNEYNEFTGAKWTFTTNNFLY